MAFDVFKPQIFTPSPPGELFGPWLWPEFKEIHKNFQSSKHFPKNVNRILTMYF